jgi:plasmid stability protein
MPDILIRDVPPPLHRKLKEVAHRHRRSMTRQALELLEESLQRAEAPQELPAPFKGRFPLTKKLIDEGKRLGRA